jgi:hypothetical protein
MIGHKRRRDGMVITRKYDDEPLGCLFLVFSIVTLFIFIAFLAKSMKY